MRSPSALYAFSAYAYWGFTPLYWKIDLLQQISPFELLSHRILWSAVFLVPLFLQRTTRQELLFVLRDRNQWLWLVGSSVLIGVNWYHYVLSMVTHRVLQSSLGYFLTPLFSVLIAVVLFRERMNRWQVASVSLATIGVLCLSTGLDELPWLALILGSTFAFYGFFKKMSRAQSLMGLMVEVVLLSPIALGYVVKNAETHDWTTWVLLLLSGPIVTALPLWWYAIAIQRGAFLVVGFLQYVSPVIQFVLAVFLYHEPFSGIHQIAFGIIWLGLIIFCADLWRKRAPTDRKRACIPTA